MVFGGWYVRYIESFILLKLLFLKFTMTSSLRWIVVRSPHSFWLTYLLPSILSIIPSSLLVFKIGSVLMVFLLIGSNLISHFVLRQSQSMIPSLHSLLFLVVYPQVPYLTHSLLLSIQLLLARWSQKIHQIPFVRWWHPAVHLFHSNEFCSISWITNQNVYWHSLLDELEQTASQSIKKWISSHWHNNVSYFLI